MPTAQPMSVVVGGMMIQFGCSSKTATTQIIPFAPAFSATPTVVLSPFWAGQRREVGHAETIVRVIPADFIVSSNNRANNYFVSWIAVGPVSPTPALTVVSDSLTLLSASTAKPTVAHTVGWGGLFASPPNVQVSPFFSGSARGVGHAETINSITPTGFTGSSDNRAPPYSVSWIATGTTPGTTPIAPPTVTPGVRQHMAFIVDDMLVEVGRVNKTDGVLRQPLGLAPGFSAPPVVVVSPFLATPVGGVGHAETINEVDENFFEVVSGNAASSYDVSFIAIGPRR